MEIQSPEQPDAVHNWRPGTLSPPPISIYHPVFAQFTRELSADPNSVSFTGSEYDDAMDVMAILLEFYYNENYKRESIGKTCLFWEKGNSLLRVTRFPRGGGGFIELDGHRLSHVPALNLQIPSEIIAVKNEMGDGGADGLAIAERDYVCLHTSDEVSSSDVTVIITGWKHGISARDIVMFEDSFCYQVWCGLRLHRGASQDA